jgi:hypothetical protein
MTDSTLVFIDTETTSLRPDRRAWDIALIRRNPDGTETEHQWYVGAHDLDLGNADPFALRIGHFYERHPQYRLDKEFDWHVLSDEDDTLGEIEALTRDAHLVGCVPNFDADVLGTRMRAHGILPAWHYHLIDVEALVVGWVAHKAQHIREDQPTVDLGPWPRLPWRSDDLSRAIGIELPPDEDRHTALGNARWARDMYDAVMGVQVPKPLEVAR